MTPQSRKQTGKSVFRSTNLGLYSLRQLNFYRTKL